MLFPTWQITMGGQELRDLPPIAYTCTTFVIPPTKSEITHYIYYPTISQTLIVVPPYFLKIEEEDWHLYRWQDDRYKRVVGVCPNFTWKNSEDLLRKFQLIRIFS